MFGGLALIGSEGERGMLAKVQPNGLNIGADSESLCRAL
jgi:hypothetical protein